MTTSIFTDHYNCPLRGLFKSIIERFFYFSVIFLASGALSVYKKLFPLPGIYLLLDMRHPRVCNVLYNGFLMYYEL